MHSFMMPGDDDISCLLFLKQNNNNSPIFTVQKYMCASVCVWVLLLF